MGGGWHGRWRNGSPIKIICVVNFWPGYVCVCKCTYKNEHGKISNGIFDYSKFRFASLEFYISILFLEVSVFFHKFDRRNFGLRKCSIEKWVTENTIQWGQRVSINVFEKFI